MPIYEYACGSCGHHFEAKQKFSDDPIATCPECGQTVRRVLHPAGIIFKGSGFYINDSRNSSSSATTGSNGKSATDTSSTSSSSDSSSTTSTESKSTPVSSSTDSP